MALQALTRRPLVTFIMAAYDAGEHIRATLDSISRQTVDSLEVIVVDDGSTDATARTVELASVLDCRIRLVTLPFNRGQAFALNVGAEQARGRHLAGPDADDVAIADRLEHQLAALEQDRDLILVGGAVQPWSARHGAMRPAWRYAGDGATIRVRSLFKSEFISGAMTFDREQFVRHGPRFDERLRLGADWAISMQAMRVGCVANVEQVVMKYRIHPGQLTTGMMDDLSYDSTRLRREWLEWVSVRPTDDELRTHLVVSPCNYWPFGAHTFFRQRRDTIAEDARRWFERLTAAATQSGRVSRDALRAYLEEISSAIGERLAAPEEALENEPAPAPARGARPGVAAQEPTKSAVA